MTPAQAVIALHAHPRKWLEKHYLNAFAGVPAAFAVQTPDFGNTGYVDAAGLVGPPGGLVFNHSPGTAKKFLGWTGRDRRAFTFDRTGGQAAFVGPVVATPVANIPVVGSDTLGPLPGGVALGDLSTVGVCGFAITTLLNGCTFIIDGAAPSVAHVQPKGGTTSAGLRALLAPHFGLVYGGGGNEYDHAVEDVTIIGVNRGGAGWKIYAQVHARNSRDILRVEKLHG